MVKTNGNELTPSLTIRAYFAGLAMQGLSLNKDLNVAETAEVAVMMADALIAELNKEKP